MWLFINSIPKIAYINPYTLTFYAISYLKNGFMARAFIGTLLDIFGVTEKNQLLYILYIISTMFIGFISYILNIFINKFEKRETIFIALMFIFNPASITLIYQNLEIGRFDIFIYVLSIISVYFIHKEKYLYIVPIISIIGMLIHENYLMWLAPLTCMMLIYKYVNTKDKKFLKILLFNVGVLLGTLLLIRMFKPPYETALEFYDALNKNSNIPLNYFALNDYYYITPYRKKELFILLFQLQKTSAYIIAAVGYIYTLYLLWNICFKRIWNTVKSKLVYVLMILSCLSPAVLFFLACDYGRWYTYLINTLFVLAMFLFFEYENVYKKEMKNNKIYIQLIVIYLIIFILLYQSDQFYLLTYTKFEDFKEFIFRILNI